MSHLLFSSTLSLPADSGIPLQSKTNGHQAASSLTFQVPQPAASEVHVALGPQMGALPDACFSNVKLEDMLRRRLQAGLLAVQNGE